MLGHQLRLECACPVAGDIDAHLAAVGEERLTARAVAVIAGAVSAGGAFIRAEVNARLRAERGLNERLLEYAEGQVEPFRRHRPGDEVLQQCIGDGCVGRCVCRLCGLLLAWHTCSR